MEKLGRYDLIRVLGKGAMGMVYEARDPNLDRRVAIKTIKVENLSEEEAAEYELRFRTEARSAARLQHPNIVSVYDSDRDVNVAYLVIEFINGEDLKHHLDRGDVYTLAQTLSIMGDLLSALDYAHRHGVVHRDVKPANLLLEPGGRVKLADFGVARMQDSGDATRTQGSMVGTLKYMSPEQVQSQSVDARADLFAAGIVLYQLLTGVRPFDGGSDFEIIQKITSQNPVPPSTLTPGLPPAIDGVVARALEKSRENRFPSAQAFRDALFAAVHDADADQTIAPRSKTRAPRAPAPGERTNGGSASGVSATVTQELELVYWKDITESTDRADFEGFLERFPSGIYADLAKRKLKRLGLADGSGSGASTVPGNPGRQGDEDITQALAPRASQPNERAQGAAPMAPPALASAPSSDNPPPPAPPPVPPEPPLPPAQEPSDAAPAAPSSARRRWGAVAAGVVVVMAVLGYWLWPAAPAGDGVAVSAPSAASPVAPAASVPTPAVQAGAASVALPALAPAAMPAVAVVESVAPAPPVPAPRATAVAKPSAAAVPSARAASEHAKAAEAASSAAAGKTPPVTAAAASSDPRVPCKDRWLLAYQICLTRKCAEATFAQHPVCVERHEMEQNSKNRAKPGF